MSTFIGIFYFYVNKTAEKINDNNAEEMNEDFCVCSHTVNSH